MSATPVRTQLTLRHVLMSSRPLSWVNTAFPFATTYLLTGGHPDAVWWIGTVFFLFPYNLAMYGINDVFDHASDMLNPRKGGVEGSLLNPQTHRALLWVIAAVCVPWAVALQALGNWVFTAVFTVTLFAVAAYSLPRLRFKERPILDSLTSSTHFSAPVWCALALTQPPINRELITILMAFFLWGVSSHAFGAIQDIVPDTEAGISSVATAFGARTIARASTLLYLVSGLLLVNTSPPTMWASAFAIPYCVNTARYWNIDNTHSGEAHAGWRVFLWLNYLTGFGISLLMIWSAWH